MQYAVSREQCQGKVDKWVCARGSICQSLCVGHSHNLHLSRFVQRRVADGESVESDNDSNKENMEGGGSQV